MGYNTIQYLFIKILGSLTNSSDQMVLVKNSDLDHPNLTAGSQRE